MSKLSKEQIQQIAHVVIMEQEKMRKHSRKAESNKRLRNIEILLDVYPKLRAHVRANPEAFIQDPDLYEALTGVKVSDHELARYNIKTVQLMGYVRSILAAYKKWCLGGNLSEHRRWFVLCDSYLARRRLTQDQQAEKWHVDRSRISRDQSKAKQELSSMLFGVQGLEDFVDAWIA